VVVEEREITVGGDARPARFTSYDVEDFPVPTGREEEWRFTPLKRLKGLLKGADADGKVQIDVDGLGDGVTVTSIERDHPLVGSVLSPVERISAIAFAGFTSGTLISVAKRAVVEQPVTVTLRGEGGTAYGHLVLDVGDEASATIVLDHSGSATYAQNVEIRVGANASLTLVTVQDWARDTVHVGYHAALVGRDARFRSFTVTLGGDLVRLAPTVRYAGSGGDAELHGLVFADAGQHLEHRTLIDHETPKCRSRVAYKVALQGEGAHTVWIGDVVVRKAAEGIDTYELNRNLVLSEGARADSVPNLELETGEVEGAGHASTTGRFDDQQLFYLQSRGIPAVEARRMVVRAFFAEVIAKVPVEHLRDRLTGQIEAELEGSGV
jgi:Fe-S cluster assembly protein SufD